MFICPVNRIQSDYYLSEQDAVKYVYDLTVHLLRGMAF